MFFSKMSSAALFALAALCATGCGEAPTTGFGTVTINDGDAGTQPDATQPMADAGTPDLGMADVGPEIASGTIEPCQTGTVAGVWTTNIYTNLPHSPGATRNHGAGLVDYKWAVGGDGDIYRSFIRLPLDGIPTNVQVTSLVMVLSVYRNESPRVTVSMSLRVILEPWTVHQLDTDDAGNPIFGMRWVDQPETGEVAQLDAPVEDRTMQYSEYRIDLMPVYVSDHKENGFALFPTGTRAQFNNFVSCSGEFSEQPIIEWTGVRR